MPTASSRAYVDRVFGPWFSAETTPGDDARPRDAGWSVTGWGSRILGSCDGAYARSWRNRQVS